MLKVHHLNNSRSQRILWLLEELDAPYEIVRYQRDAVTNLAPPELKAVHPLGKSPVITDGALTIAESGAAVEYIIERYGAGALRPDPASDAYWRYVEWLHYAEGSAMLPLMMNLYVLRLGEAGAPLHERISSEIDNHLGYVAGALGEQPFLMGEALTGADIQVGFVAEVARAFGRLAQFANLLAYVERLQARPAYRRAIEKGGPYNLAG
jgi:glutathione S-transferase